MNLKMRRGTVRVSVIMTAVLLLTGIYSRGQLYNVPKNAPALTTAVINRQAKELNKLIRMHADPDVVDSNGWTPLLYAVMNNDREIVRLLLKSKCNVNFKTKDGDSALSLAVAFMRPLTARILLERGADPNRTGPGGLYPVFQAASMNQLDLVQLLIHYRAKVDVKGPRGISVLTLPCNLSGDKCVTVVQYLVTHKADVNGASVAGDTPLMDAAGAGNVKIAKILIAAGAKTSTKNKKGEMAVDVARRHHYDKLAAILSSKR